MINYIKKRNGEQVEFNKNKIKQAVLKATKAVDMEDQQIAEEITREVVSYLNIFSKESEIPSVEQVQDLVEKILIEHGYSDIAKAYILYRDQHSKIRNTKQLFSDAIDSISDYLDRSDWKVNENSNMGYSLQGLNNHISSEVTAQYWLQEIYPQEIQKTHSNGDLHIHDLGNLSVYCCGWDLRDLLLNGFGGVPTKVESKPPKHFRTALMQSVNFLYTLQGEAAGAMAFSNFDTYLAPFIAYDDLNYEEVKQGMQEFIYNLNVPTRVGFQTPFTNITMDLEVPNNIKDEPIVIGGELQAETYGQFQEEMDMLNRAFAEVMLEGDKKGRVFSFPIPTYNITPDFDWDNELLEPVWEMTAKYGIPYFSNFVNSDMNPEDIRSMCCRLQIDNTELRKRGGGLFGANPLTGCYDDKTEIMTEDGWKLFSELSYEDSVFTLSENNQIELYQPKKIFEYDWAGQLYRFNHKSLDLLVTPNHRMVYDDANTMERGFVRADEFNGNVHRIPKQGAWDGIEQEYFLLPAIENSWISGNYNSQQEYKKEELAIDMDLWLKFFGIFISEGSVDNDKIAQSHGYRVVISQNKKKIRKKIEQLLNEMPFNYRIEGKNYIICNKQLWSYLKQFGNCYSKYIPQEIKALSARQLKTLFKWLMHGDGHIRPLRGIAKTRQMSYYTASRQLADDLQELIMKIGYISTISQRNRGVMEIEGRKINTTTQYTVGVQQSKHYRLRNRNIDTEYYSGKVYCCEVENNTVMVRRNGKTTWCGNSVGVVTLNMPRIGYQADSKEEFLEQTYKLMDIAQESLEIKREVLENLTAQGLYPYSKFYLRDIKERFDEYWKNHFNTIGLNGMNEALLNFMGQDISTPEGQEFAVEVMEAMRSKLVEYQEETGNIYNLEATPAEGTSYRFAKMDKDRFGSDIICANQERVMANDADPYYTNSTQLPVGHTTDIFQAFQLQDPLQKLYTGGTVLHGFIGEKMPSIESTKKLVKRLAHNFELPYYSITPTFSICPKHGYLAGEHEYCPKCDAEMGYEEGE
ncbi:MAG: ribonucleoside triphosphate reductase [Bacillota bacterium]